MYLGLVFFTDIWCHKTGTSLIPCASLFLRPSPLPDPTSLKTRKLDCSWFSDQTRSLKQSLFQELERLLATLFKQAGVGNAVSTGILLIDKALHIATRLVTQDWELNTYFCISPNLDLVTDHIRGNLFLRNGMWLCAKKPYMHLLTITHTNNVIWSMQNSAMVT